MSYLVRKFSEKAWPDGEERLFESVQSLNADCITNGLNTTQNTLSWWYINDLVELESMAVSIASVFQSKGRIFVVAIPFNDVKEKDIKAVLSEEDAETAVVSFKNRHFNLENLTYSQLGILAELVAINSQIPTNRKTLSFNQIKESIEQSIQQGDIDKNLLGSIFKK